MQPEWWHWAVLGIGLIIAELAVPAFFVIWFGLGAVLVSLMLLAAPALSLTVQLLAWTFASVAMVALWFRIFKPGAHKTRIGMADAHVIGEAGILVRAVAPFEKGQVRFQKPLLGSEVWACIADEAIIAGERVKVLGVEGSFLKVGKP
ncbi:MAG: NfeD family protein [Zoogloeaceae bacterium]|jgi:membrane protein implicated in regulation of membrane protease activity|nr:NfeD family protein [Zoogloeaceae bacterium]